MRNESLFDRADIGGAPTLDLHGLLVDDAVCALDQFLSANASEEVVKVVTGKGTGALRSAIEQELQQHPAVADYRDSMSHDVGAAFSVILRH